MKGIDASLVVVSATTEYDKDETWKVVARTCDGCGEKLVRYFHDSDEDNHTVLDCLRALRKKLK